jgi:hypothetical protein
MKNRQRGISPVGVLIFGAFFGFVLLLAFRTVPAVTEYFAIQRIIRLVAAEGDAGAPVVELRRSFDRRSQIDDVATVTGADLDIAKPGGKVVIDVEYERRVPVAGNVSLVIEFRATSAEQ